MLSRRPDTEDLSDDLPTVEGNLATIRENLDQYGDVVDVKQPQMYRVLLAARQAKPGEWRTALAAGGKQLIAWQARLDTLGAQRPPVATAVGRALARLQGKEDRATQLLRRSRQTVTGLQTRVSDGYIQTLELQDVVREQMGRFNRRNSAAERPPLWHPGSIRADAQARALVRKSYAAQRSLMSYYFAENRDYWVGMVALALGFFGWVFRNFRTLRLAAAQAPTPSPALELPAHRLHYLRPVPVAAALLVVFSLAPFFDLHAPAAYPDLLLLLLGDAHGAGLAQLAAGLVLVLGGHCGSVFCAHAGLCRAGAGPALADAAQLGRRGAGAGFLALPAAAPPAGGLRAAGGAAACGPACAGRAGQRLWPAERGETDLDQARQLITEEMLGTASTLHKVAPETLLNSVNTAGYDLKALFWINNIC